MKMTVADEIKILERKIKQNEAQYDLDKKKAAEISALSSANLDKCEDLTGEDLIINQVRLSKLNLNLHHLVRCLIKEQMKKTKKKDFLRD